MHNYIAKCSKPQPPAVIKQMPPAMEMPNPKLVDRAVREMQMMQQPPMSTTDGVNITITISPADGEQYVQQRSQDILSQVLMNAQNQTGY